MADCNATKNATTGAYNDPALQRYTAQLANVTATLLKTRAGKAGRLAFVLTTPSPQTKECCTDPSDPAVPGMMGTETCVKRTVVFNQAARALLREYLERECNCIEHCGQAVSF